MVFPSLDAPISALSRHGFKAKLYIENLRHKGEADEMDENILGILGALALRGREGWRMRVVSGSVALVVLVGTLTMLGCGAAMTMGTISTPPAPGTTLTNATASNLANRVFTFPNGFSTNPPTLTGLPPGQAFTLRFGDFAGTITGPMTLESAGNIASGTVTIGSCIFQINQSTFPASQGPPAGTKSTANPPD